MKPSIFIDLRKSKPLPLSQCCTDCDISNFTFFSSLSIREAEITYISTCGMAVDLVLRLFSFFKSFINSENHIYALIVSFK